MKKRFEIYLNSLKQSALHKPAALAMFVLMIIMATVACGFASRITIGEIEREIYPSSGSLICKESTQYVAAGDYMRELKGEHFDGFQNGCYFFASKATVKHNGAIVNVGGMAGIKLEVFADKFSDSDIKNGRQIMYVNSVFCNEFGVGIGDSVTFCGSDFEIVGMQQSDHWDKDKMIIIPYSANIANKSDLKLSGIEYVGIKKNFGSNVYEKFEGFGLVKGKRYMSSVIFQGLIMLMLFLVASSLSVISVTNYWQSVNMQKYNIYKTIGASPKTMAGIMFFESGIVASLAVGVGLLVDFIISLAVNIGEIVKMLWLHYLILFFATLFAVMIMVGIKIVKIAKTLPMEQATTKKGKKGGKHEKD